ncbi:MAG: class I SAM-dependent methyltransferase [Hyphomicrobiaceae bacterium]
MTEAAAEGPSAYDPRARRKTPLARLLTDEIQRSGPMSVSDYMAACLDHETLGYYRTRPAIGRGGDFITSPEISQTFGELIGAWAIVVWQQFGSPPALDLIELGPGRGTLMADALRLASRVPAFASSARVVLVETNPLLRNVQAETLSGLAAVHWVDALGAVEAQAERPAIVLANEFLDTRPVRQFRRVSDTWRERLVGLDAHGALTYLDGPDLSMAAAPRDLSAAAHLATLNADDGAIAEVAAPLDDLLGPLAARSRRQPVVALFIDYGHLASATGDTLQAIRNHLFEHPLTSPGEADLTCQVDFSVVESEARTAGLVVDGPVTQAEFLGGLGIIQRASRLMSANPSRAGEIETDVLRLIAPTGMGMRFKVIAIRSPHTPRLPGFETA